MICHQSIRSASPSLSNKQAQPTKISCVACNIPPIRSAAASFGFVPIQSISARSIRSDLPIINDWPMMIQNFRLSNLNLHPGGDQSRLNWYRNGIKMASKSQNVSLRYHLRHLNAGPLTLLVACDSVLGWWQW